MKQLNNYISDKINESVNNDLVKFITETDFTSITNGHPCRTKAERVALAKIQEQEVVEIINKASTRFVAIRTETLFNKNNKRFSSLDDLKNGDVVIKDTQTNQRYYIDVKVGTGKTYYGSVNANSIVNFAKNSNNHFYLIFNSDAQEKIFVDANKLYTTFERDPQLYTSKNRGDVIDLKAKINITGDTNDTDVSKTCKEDFIGTGWLNKYFKPKQ